jgi:class 3 adenylate cyclase
MTTRMRPPWPRRPVSSLAWAADPAPSLSSHLLFTDIVGSKELASRLGDAAWRKLLDQHHAVVRRELGRFQGRELSDGKIVGIAVSIGARIASLAQPGEVLVSGTVKDLVAGSGLCFEDRGEHALKGVPDPWRLFALTS